MKYLTATIAGLLGALFVFASVTFFLHLGPQPPQPAPGSPTALFMGALLPTGYFTMIKLFELVGGVLVAIPPTRRAGLLILGPIIVNILAFHIFIEQGKDLGIALILAAVAIFLLWAERRAFAAFLRGG